MMLVGYARVSTLEQHLDAQLARLAAAGCEPIYQEKRSVPMRNVRCWPSACGIFALGEALVVTRLTAWRAHWVSGSSETKTYGKGVTLREREEQPTLPRRSIFGKDIDERAHIIQCVARAVLSPRGAIFGKVVGYSYRGTMVSIMAGAGFIGKNASLQVSEISCVLRYRSF